MHCPFCGSNVTTPDLSPPGPGGFAGYEHAAAVCECGAQLAVSVARAAGVRVATVRAWAADAGPPAGPLTPEGEPQFALTTGRAGCGAPVVPHAAPRPDGSWRDRPPLL